MNERTSTAAVADDMADRDSDGIAADSAGKTVVSQDAPVTAAAQEQENDHCEAAEFQNLKQESGPIAQSKDANLKIIQDISVTMSMEIGRTKISIQKLLQLARGSVVELDRLASEPLDILVNGTLVARGEVVVVNEKFGVRLIEVISPNERANTLK